MWYNKDVIMPTEETQQMLKVWLRDVETIIFPYMLSQSSVLLVVVVYGDPKFGRPVQIS
jgi:hypothetical protein